MKDIKIVFTDLDGTLTKEKGIIDIENKRIFERLDNIGVYVVINTGRSVSYTIPICKQFMTSKYIIASNGAEIYDYINKKSLYKSVISKENLSFLDELVKKYNTFFVANSTLKNYTNKKNVLGNIYCESLLNINEEITQVVIESYDIEVMKEIRRELSITNNLVIANKTKHITLNKLLYYDIVNNGVNKGTATKILCDHLGINTEKAMAVGDSTNDYEMLKSVGYKVAVMNASDDLKEIADVITLSNKENGVCQILTDLYKNKI